MIQEIKKENNPFKMWGFWLGFVVGFSMFFFSSIKPSGCSPQYASWNKGVYFGLESFNFIGSSDCTNFVTPKYKFCEAAMSYYSHYAEPFEDIMERRDDCLENPNKYPFEIGGEIDGDPNIKITVDNVGQELLGGNVVFKMRHLLFSLIHPLGLVFAIILGTLGWVLHLLFRLFKKI